LIHVGMATYGNLKYTKLAYNSLVEHTDTEFDIYIVIGKPGDQETLDWVIAKDIPYILHGINKGFPYSVNDIYDFFWSGDDTSPILIIGNDVVVYPNAVDKLYEKYLETGADWISSSELFIPESFTEEYPELRDNFKVDLELKLGLGYSFITDLYEEEVSGNCIDLKTLDIIGDSHNLTLFSRKLFDTIGYIDTNFFPAYFEDNDYGRRAILSDDIQMLKLEDSHYFHFWSRTIYEEGTKKMNDNFFPHNKEYYKYKWGGFPGSETLEIPFDSKIATLGLWELPYTLGIFTRECEEDILEYWRVRYEH